MTKWLCILAVLWGIATACTAATFNYHSLLVTRIFAGLFESPVSPCMMLISSQWYTSKEQASRYSFWFCGAGLAQISGAFISYGFQQVHNTTLISSWRIMYLTLGLITSFVGVVGFFILPKSPMTAKFLTDSEKVALLNHIAVNQTGIENRHFKWSQLKEIVLDIQIWLLVAMTISVCTHYYTQFVTNPRSPGNMLQRRYLLLLLHCDREPWLLLPKSSPPHCPEWPRHHQLVAHRRLWGSLQL